MKVLALAGPLVLGAAVLVAAPHAGPIARPAEPAGVAALPAGHVVSPTPARQTTSLTSPTLPAQPAAPAVRVGADPAPRPGEQSRFGWPLSPRPRVLRRFEPPAHDWLPGHRGVDLAATAGQHVLSAGDGAVGFSGTIAGVGIVTVVHAHGLRTTYQPVLDRLPAGTPVRRGDTLGVLDDTTTHCPPSTCLHWGLLRGTVYLDPLTLLGYGHPVLLPLRP